MRESEHFNLFLAEGSDIVNPLVQDVQNYVDIDAQMFKNQNAGVQNATELKSGTVHAITRNVPDAQFITFTATSNYTAGETFTVDGVQVSALTVSGETLPTGAYVINSQVLCVLKGTLLTFYGIGSEVADNSLALNGHPDTYFGTKEEVDNAIDTANAVNVLVEEINNKLKNVAVTQVDLFSSNSMGIGYYKCYLRNNELHLGIMLYDSNNNFVNGSTAFSLRPAYIPKSYVSSCNAQVSARFGERFPAVVTVNTDGTVKVTWQGGLAGNAGEIVIDIIYPLD